MNVVFRTDASLLIGTGHVMRCLTLADGLKKRGARCIFISRAHQGNLNDQIRQLGFETHALAVDESFQSLSSNSSSGQCGYTDWLGSAWDVDARLSKGIVEQVSADWLIVDHYGLNFEWECNLRGSVRHLMVLDDLADRAHACDLLLDQTFARDASEYQALVDGTTVVLCGSDYALLRPEFSEMRQESLYGRRQPALRNLQISMGGIDKDNVTSQVLLALEQSQLSPDASVTVVMGAKAPWIEHVQSLADRLPFKTDVLVNVTHMAKLLSQCDLAIGAAGSSAWERSCLGVPSILVVLADNQNKIATEMDRAGAAIVIRDSSSIIHALPAVIQGISSADLRTMSSNAAKLVDGAGLDRVIGKMLEAHHD